MESYIQLPFPEFDLIKFKYLRSLMEPKPESVPEEKNPNLLAAMPQNIQNILKAQAEKKFLNKDEPSNQEMLNDPSIKNAFLQRKQDSFNQLKKWDDKRSLFLNTHRNLIETILLKLDKRIKISSSSMASMMQFLKDRIQLENDSIKFLNGKMTKLGGLYRDTEHNANIELYPGLTKALCELDDLNLKKVKSLTEFVKFLENNILCDIFQKDQSEYEKRISQFKDRIVSLKKSLSNLNVEAIQKSSKYSKLFQEMLQDTTNKFKSEKKDLYMYEMAFVRAANEQNTGSKKLAKETLDLWQECLKLECARIDCIKRGFQFYLAKYAEVYGKSTSIDVPNKILEIIDPVKESEGQFLISKILTPEELTFIKKTIDKSDITFKELKVFFEEFEIKDMPQKPLVKKELTVMRDVGGLTKSFKDCLFIVTIDNNLLILDNPKEDDVNESTPCLNIENLSITARKDPMLYDLVEKVPGFLFDTSNKYLIKVPNEDKLDELMHYLNLKK